MSQRNGEVLLSLNNVSKTFVGVKALTDVDFCIHSGEVVALCGENGAGKSTLVKYIAGIHDCDPGGKMIYQGKEVHFKSALEAKNAGICLVFQEVSLMTDLSIAENIFVGQYPTNRLHMIDYKAMRERAKKCLDLLDFPMDPMTPVSKLSLAQQQLVEIAKALVYDPKLIILDEPTSSLTDKEKQVLFKNINALKKSGVAVIYISHRMDEIFEISDRIMVLRDGCVVGKLNTKESNVDDIVKLMIGRTLNSFYYKSTYKGNPAVAMEVCHLTKKGLFHDISFKLHKGEILGLYGLVGAGRSEIIETIFAIRKQDSGTVKINGENAMLYNSTWALKYGIALVPENRKTQGLILDADCKDNMNLAILAKLRNGLFIDDKKEEENYNTYKEKMSINSPGSWQKCGNLSGGNQQKIILAKWLLNHPDILILDEPTIGVDVASKSEIHKLIAEIASQGVAVIVISSEMPEIIGVSNRILTITEGEITGELVGDEITEENIMNHIAIRKSKKIG